jgi:hypothetical protein
MIDDWLIGAFLIEPLRNRMPQCVDRQSSNESSIINHQSSMAL